MTSNRRRKPAYQFPESPVVYELLFSATDGSEHERLSHMTANRVALQRMLDQGVLPLAATCQELACDALALWHSLLVANSNVFINAPYDDDVEPPLFVGLEVRFGCSVFAFEVVQIVRLYARVACASAAAAIAGEAQREDCVCTLWVRPDNDPEPLDTGELFGHCVRAYAYMVHTQQHVLRRWVNYRRTTTDLQELIKDRPLEAEYARAIGPEGWSNLQQLLRVYAETVRDLDTWRDATATPDALRVIRQAWSCGQELERVATAIQHDVRAPDSTQAPIGHTLSLGVADLNTAKAVLYPGYAAVGLQVQCLARIYAATYFQGASDYPGARWALKTMEHVVMVEERLNALRALCETNGMPSMEPHEDQTPVTWSTLVATKCLEPEPLPLLEPSKLARFESLVLS